MVAERVDVERAADSTDVTELCTQGRQAVSSGSRGSSGATSRPRNLGSIVDTGAGVLEGDSGKRQVVQ